jgi:hypothetical protein
MTAGLRSSNSRPDEDPPGDAAVSVEVDASDEAAFPKTRDAGDFFGQIFPGYQTSPEDYAW